MAIQTIKYGMAFPPYPVRQNIAPDVSGDVTTTIDASGEKIALIYKATAAKSIRKVYIRTATVTTGDTVDVRIETVSGTDGNPTGTLWATNTNASLTIADTDDNVWLQTAALTADATVAVGDVFAVVVVNGSTPGNLQLAVFGDEGPGTSNGGFPYGSAYTASWAKMTRLPLIAVEYSDGSYEPLLGYNQIGAPITSTTFNSGSATNRLGNIFQLPFPCRVNGCWAWVDADGDFSVKVYDSDGTTVLATTGTFDKDWDGASAAGLFFIPFIATANLSANTNYRLAIVAETTTNLTVYQFDVPTANMLDMFACGTNFYSSVYTSGSWAETTTQRTYIGLFANGFDDATGGGGGGLLTNPGMGGGMRG